MSYVNSLAQSNYLRMIMGNQQNQISKLQSQVASGNKADDFSGYTPTEGRIAISLSNSLSRNKQYSQNVILLSNQTALAESSLTKTHNVLTGGNDDKGTGSIASTIANIYLNVASKTTNAVGALQQSAQNALEQVIGFYNQSLTGNYVFAGRGSQPPLIDAGTLSNNVKAAIVAGLPGSGAFATGADASKAVDSVFLDQTAANKNNLNIANLNQWFSGNINDSPGEPLPISDNQYLAVDISALPSQKRSGPVDPNTNMQVDPTYGIMDSIRSLAALANVSLKDFGTGPDAPEKYQQFLQGQLKTLSLADQEINTMTAVNGNNRALLSQTSSLLSQQALTLSSSIASDESVDQATAITNLQNLQAQLSATYQVTALLKNLSLVNYIGGAS
ncbi:MAG: hypothetical protein ORN98_11320 [Alphaproteobacteria bacterium]|nr:hypothetical protein [Alphaproteobacteria bacterium]